ncbi:hypothetical protein ACHAWU_006660 [Discostella pseudostelligera]|uniref:Sulfotransferase domain-containing protein n=1 Tax=Discostella pseudostelligera TaxID=259834 RepID=A0ABD3M148_9STRA
MSITSPSSNILHRPINNSTLAIPTTMQSPAAHAMHHRGADDVYTINAANASLLVSSSMSNDDTTIHDERRDDFFDCHATNSKCTYFYPGEFYRHYFDNVVLKSTSIDAITINNYHTSNKEYIAKMGDRIGLNNANLPALNSFSWWITFGLDNEQENGSNNYTNNNSNTHMTIMNMIQHRYNLPLQNLTYIHIHKCGGTSIQGALYRRARHLRNMAFRIVHDIDNGDSDEQHTRQKDQQLHLLPPHRHQQTMQNRDADSNTTLRIKLQADVHAYRHSFGGGSLLKKAIWDAERLDHIRAIYNSQSFLPSYYSSPVSQDLQRQLEQHQQSMNYTSKQNKQSIHRAQYHYRSPHVIFTIVRDPIQRFLSAIQQVMQYNVEFRQKCLFEDNENRAESDNQRLSVFQLPSWSMLLKWRRKVHHEEEENDGEEDERAQRQQSLRRQTIQCSIQDMEQTSYRKDVHLQPMASHFRLLDYSDWNVTTFATTATTGEEKNRHGSASTIRSDGSRGIAISVFSMDDIHHVLTHFLGMNNQVDDDGEKNESLVKPSTIHMRDRSNEEYATSSILSQLSSSDCDENMIRQICALYHVDVELMKWLGFGGEAVERC